MTYTVTQQHIDDYRLGRNPNCPVHQAINDVMSGECTAVLFHIAKIGDKWLPLPDEVYRWIKAHDNGGKVQPFTFTVQWPHQN